MEALLPPPAHVVEPPAPWRVGPTDKVGSPVREVLLKTMEVIDRRQHGRFQSGCIGTSSQEETPKKRQPSCKSREFGHGRRVVTRTAGIGINWMGSRQQEHIE